MILLNEAQVKQCLNLNLARCIEWNKVALGSLRWKRKNVKRQTENNNHIQENHDARVFVPTRISIPYHSDESELLSLWKETKSCSSIDNTDIDTNSTCAISTNNNDTNNAQDTTLFKPAAYFPPSPSSDNDDNNQYKAHPIMGMKIVSMRAKNTLLHKPTVPANIILLDAQTGEMTSIVAATYLTAARTAAGSVIATDICLRHLHAIHNGNNQNPIPPIQLVLFGAGLQAEMYIRCLAQIPALWENLKHITIINRSIERGEILSNTARQFLAQNQTHEGDQDERDASIQQAQANHQRNTSSSSLSSSSSLPTIKCIPLSNEKLVQMAVGKANVIVTATNASKPLFDGDWVQSPCHISGVGSYQPNTEEVCSKFVKERCITMMDTKDALNVGDLKLITEDSHDEVVGLLGDALAGEANFPSNSFLNNNTQMKVKGYCTFYKSVGTAIQDIITAQKVVQTAFSKGIGTNVDMSLE